MNADSYQSLDFYKHHAEDYAANAASFLETGYRSSSHPKLRGDQDLLERLLSLAPGTAGLDAGCGAGAKDVHYLAGRGCDVRGVDAVDENIALARAMHPEIADRVQVADLSQPLSFPSDSFDFVMCNAVIQHIDASVVKETTIRELVRVLRTGGVLQLMFKNGQGVENVLDPDYGGISRTFQLYDEHDLISLLAGYGCTLVEPENQDSLGGIMYLVDSKPMEHCVFHVVKTQ